MLAMLETAKELADTYLDDEQVGFGYWYPWIHDRKVNIGFNHIGIGIGFFHIFVYQIFHA